MADLDRGGVPWAGLAAGSAGWVINTQASLSLASFVCAHRINVVTPLAGLLGLMALAGAFLSWQAWRAGGGLTLLLSTSDGRPRLFLAGIGIGAGILFALVIATQGAAGLVLNGCER